jgi:hypothetical protein
MPTYRPWSYNPLYKRADNPPPQGESLKRPVRKLTTVEIAARELARQQDAVTARAEYEERQRKMDENMARLRSLRMEKTPADKGG